MFQQIFSPEENKAPRIPSVLFADYPSIATDTDIHNGWPHIKETRVLASDIFRAIVEGYSFSSLLFNLKKIGVKNITQRQLQEAFAFTVELLMSYIRDKKAFQKTR